MKAKTQMSKVVNQSELKPLIKETLNEMIRDNKEEIREMINEAIEEIAMANAVREGRKNDYVSEKRILKILEK
jgi:ribosomal protein S20